MHYRPSLLEVIRCGTYKGAEKSHFSFQKREREREREREFFLANYMLII
jgi:hypothetical protein